MKKKQFLALALSVVMAGGMLAGCGSSNGSSSSSKGDAKDEVVTLKWIQVGNGMPKDYDEWLEQINPYLEEKIGVNVDMEIVPWGDWDNRRSVITNSGEYFDILFTDQNRYSKRGKWKCRSTDRTKAVHIRRDDEDKELLSSSGDDAVWADFLFPGVTGITDISD